MRKEQKPPDLGTQLEDLLVVVWRLEAQWRFEERLQRLVRLAR